MLYDWISRHHEIITVFTNVSMLLIWIIYAQLLYLSFRRQRSPRLIINRGRNRDINALCIISNMSAESIFIEYIIVELDTSEGTLILDVTDLEQEYNKGDEPRNDGAPNNDKLDTLHPAPKLYNNTRQGPIGSGEFLHIGIFNELLQRIARDELIKMDGPVPKGELTFNRLTLRLIGIYGPDNLPIGAERSFNLAYNPDDKQCALKPDSWNTQRRKLRKMVEQFNSTNFISSSSYRHMHHQESLEAAERASKRG